MASFPASTWDGTSSNQANVQDNKAPDFRDWDVIVDEVIAIEESLGPVTADKGTPNGTGVELTETIPGKIVVQELTLTNVAITIATSGDGFGSLKILDPPAGTILILGAHCDLTLTTVGADIDADAAVILSLGSVVAADDTTLTSTEANIVPSTAFTLAGSTKHAVANSTAPVTLIDPDVYLNIVVPDADRTDNSQDITVTGTIKISYIKLS